MPDKILHKRSLSEGSVPTTSSLSLGEFAINVADGKVYFRRSGSYGDVIQTLVATNNITTGSVTISGSLSITGSLISPNITGSLLGTASWSNNAISSSYALTASHALNVPQTASYAVSASIADNAITASYSLVAVSSSYSLSSSYAENSSTASYVLNAVSSSYALSASNAFTASYSISSSISDNAITASYVLNAVSSSYALTASYASNVPETASYSLQALSSSFALTASYANNVPATASYALNAISSSYALSASISQIAISASQAQNAVSSSYPVRISGSTLFTPISPDNVNFSTVSNIFMGPGAGAHASGSDNSVFLGYYTGASASAASFSSFIGYNAGYGATSAVSSVFLGESAGQLASLGSYSVMVGALAGSQATNSLLATFIGYGAGRQASNANNAVFLGREAGSFATEGVGTIAIGTRAGYQNYSASYSIMIGYKAGIRAVTNPNSLGRNNIIIGNSITLDNNRQDSINIGGIIFGTGSYFDTALFNPAFSGSANGRIGINQPLPLFSLDVSGSGRYVDGLEITGSLIAPNITGSLLGTASWANNSTSSSYALTASYALNVPETASYALTASNALTASYSLIAISASQAQNAVSSSYPITVTGSTLRSVSPNGGVGGNINSSIFLGNGAGSSATNAASSNFLGSSAGSGSTNAWDSNFLGNSAGIKAEFARQSNFFGFVAGGNATSANNSNFLGNTAGNGATNANNSNFLGNTAGSSAVNANNSNFLGASAGDGATNANDSNFLGNTVGRGAINASNSNFLGYFAGFFADSASYSTLIGFQVGKRINASIGSNNIIIGTNITLADNRKDSINFGGLIFGTGSYSTISNTPFSGSANGRIGINQPLPIFSLDVSGSGRYVDGLEITGSLIAPNITGSLLGTASNAVSSSYALSASQAQNAVSSSYAFTATTASHALVALQATSASYASTSSVAISSSYSQNSTSASFATTSSHTVNAEYSDRTVQIDVYVKNISGAQINKGKVVRINGAVGDNPLIVTASYEDDNNSANTLGITTQNIPNDGFGYVITEGILIGINTDTFTAGQLLYLGPTGSIIGTAPVAPLHGVRLGEVLRVQQNNGSMYVRIDNGYELGELHDIRDTTTSSSYGDLLIKSGSVWVNSKELYGSYQLLGSVSASSFTGSLSGNAATATTASFASNIATGLSISASSIYVSNNLNVAGTASFAYVQTVTGSAVIIGQEYIILNTQAPASRFAGLQIYDSGSAATASVVWDSLTDHFVYTKASGSSYNGGMFIAGPKNTGSLGQELGLTQYRIPVAQGDDHIMDSQIYSSGSITVVTGSLTATLGFTGSIEGTASWSRNSISASYALSASQAQSSVSASYVLNAVSSSYALSASQAVNAISTSYALTATSSSQAQNSVSASYVLNAISSSFSSTASYVLNAVSASYSLSSSQAQNAVTASYILNAVSASYALSASNAQTASYILNAVSASQAQNAVTSSYVLNAISASFAATASNVLGGTTNYIPLWNTDTNLSSSIIYQSASSIGIGTTAPSAKLEVFGSGRISGAIQDQTFTGTLGTLVTNPSALLIQPAQILASSLQLIHGLISAPNALASSGLCTVVGGRFEPIGERTSTSATVSLTGVRTTVYRNSPTTPAGTSNGPLIGVQSVVGHWISQSFNANTSNVFGIQSTITGQKAVITNAYSLYGALTLGTDASATLSTVTNYYGIYNTATLGRSDGTTSATITNYYDLYLNGATVFTNGTITNRWGIYQSGSLHKNYFAANSLFGTTTDLLSYKVQISGGLYVADTVVLAASGAYVGIGTTSPNAHLDVSGSSIISGSLTVVQGITGSLLGTASWANNATTASYILNSVSASYALSASQAQNSITASYVLNAISSSYSLSSSYALNSTSASFATQASTASYVLNAVSSSFALSSSQAQNTISSSFATRAITASYADNLTVAGTLTAQTLVVQTVTSSIDFVTGSTRFGTLLANIHQFTGSVSMTGSLTVVGAGITSSLFGTSSWANNAISASQSLTASYVLNAISASYALSASQAQNSVTASYILNAVSSSYALSASQAENSVSASYAVSASQAENAISSSYPIAISGSTLYSPISPNNTGFNTFQNIILGESAAYNATNAFRSIFLGPSVAYQATDAFYSNFIGYFAGYNATNAYYSNFIGSTAGDSAINSNNSNFLGNGAGGYATNANNSNFLGRNAGAQATNADNSNFLGNEAGLGATSASYSNFLGSLAGFSATSASYSTLIGYQVGYNVAGAEIGIKSNNIIIGTNITLANGRQDSINLGGLIFGTGSYSTTTGNPFSGSANGRIGINQPLPTFNLDVSGSGRYTSGLTVTGSLIAPTITGSLQGTASWASNAITASNALTASYILNAISASYALSASQAQNAVTASYILNAVSASFAATASNVLGGAANYIPLWNGTTTLSSSVMYQSSSNVGIGTTSPIGSLEVYKSTTGGLGGHIVLSNNGLAVGNETALMFADGGAAGIRAAISSTTEGSPYYGDIKFKTGVSAYGSLSTRMIITGAGNVGIGTTSPNAKLDVNGNTIITGSLTATTTFTLDATLTDYATVASSVVGSNNLFTQATGSYTSAFFKYTVASGSSTRAGEVVAAWNGANVQFYDNSTLDIGTTTAVTSSVSIVTGNVQFNIQTNTSGWRIKSLATFI